MTRRRKKNVIPRTKKKTSTPEYDKFLPSYLWMDIFAMFPVKTLLKLRPVCKSWRTIIDSPEFISFHRNLYNTHNSKNAHLVISTSFGRLNLLRIDNCQKLTKIAYLGRLYTSFARTNKPRFLGTCNGLLLMEVSDDMYLWNPFLRKSLILPPCPFGSSNSGTHYVLGFSPIYDEYKVFAYRISRFFGVKEVKTAVYSLKTHCWKIKTNPTNVDASNSLIRPCWYEDYVYCGCIVYWFTRSDERGFLYSFDFNTEEFNTVEVPEALKERKRAILFRKGKSLVVLTKFCTWILKEHDEEYIWRLYSSRSLRADIENYGAETGLKIFVIEESNRLLCMKRDFISSCDASTLTFQRLRNGVDSYVCGGDYVETLALLTESEGMIFKRFP